MSKAEQVAIALMSEARRLYNEPEGLDYGEKEDLADRLAGWATDVRELDKLRLDLEQYVTMYEDCPVSHRPDKATIIEKLKEMLDGE